MTTARVVAASPTARADVEPRTATTAALALELPELLRASIQAWAALRYPREACGLLLGQRRGSSVQVSRVSEARNLDTERARERYDLDPVDHLAAEVQARAEGVEVVGIWHSHPDRGAVPSATDVAQAWGGWSYVIVAVSAGEARELRSWRLVAGGFEEEVVHA